MVAHIKHKWIFLVLAMIVTIGTLTSVYGLVLADTDDGVLTAPRNLRGANVEEGVQLSWDAPSQGNVTGYQVLRRRPEEIEKSLMVYKDDTSDVGTTWVDTEVSEEVRYVYRVKALSGDTVGPRSNYVNIRYMKPLPVEAPDAPGRLTGRNVGDGIELSWEAPESDGITGNQIVRRRPEQGEGRLKVYESDIASTVTTWVDTSVEDAVRYVYRVQAVNDAGAGERSNFVNLRRVVPDPYAEVLIIATLGVGRMDPGEVHKLTYNINNLPLDADAETVDLTMLANVYGSDGEDADGCEVSGMGSPQTITVVDESLEVLSIKYGNRNKAACWVDDYEIRATFTIPSGRVIRNMTVRFTVAGYDGQQHR